MGISCQLVGSLPPGVDILVGFLAFFGFILLCFALSLLPPRRLK